MNSWKIIWQSYHNTATFSKILSNILRRATWFDKIFLIVCLIGIITSLILNVILDSKSWGFFLLFISEASLLLKFESFKNNLVLLEYGDPDLSNVPPEQDKTRYLIFKYELEARGVTKTHVESCFDLADSQIAIASSSNTNLKSFLKFSSGVLVGFLGVIWRNVNTPQLILIACSLLLFGLFIGILLFFIPSQLEKLKEMKYFMMLFCREISLIQRE